MSKLIVAPLEQRALVHPFVCGGPDLFFISGFVSAQNPRDHWDFFFVSFVSIE